MRWDPHLHTPGTLGPNTFGGDWESYIAALLGADPAPTALGITDYCSLHAYKQLREKGEAVFGSIPLVFPNVEFRYSVQTKRGGGINVHLLISPDDPNHIDRAEALLSRLTFERYQEIFPCTDEGLARLGRAHKGKPTLDVHAAMVVGANQFKVDVRQLRHELDEKWARSNVLLAIASGHDGLGGLSQDASFAAFRAELGRQADIVFSGNPRDRAYWAKPQGEADADTDPKPCLHGSDAHRLEDVLQPDQERRCWLRAAPTWDGLHQALAEPERRVRIAAASPAVAPSGGVMKSLRLEGAEWFANDEIMLNDGLVTIIGAKGSGKTALADFLAFAASSEDPEPGPASFVKKAGALLNGVSTVLEWADNSIDRSSMPRVAGEPQLPPRAQYLSQQFVEGLCLPDGVSEPLAAEMERTVFAAIPPEDRHGCDTFAELRELLIARHTSTRAAHEREIEDATKRVAGESAAGHAADAAKAALAAATRERSNAERSLRELVPAATDQTGRDLEKTLGMLERLRAKIAKKSRQAAGIATVIERVRAERARATHEAEAIQAAHADLLTDEVWASLAPVHPAEPLEGLERLIEQIRAEEYALRQHGLPPGDDPQAATPNLANLNERHKALMQASGENAAKMKRRAELTERRVRLLKREATVKAELEQLEKAPERRAAAYEQRYRGYESVFECIVAERQALLDLYEPLAARIAADDRLGALSFTVERIVDHERWLAEGRELLDSRRYRDLDGTDGLVAIAPLASAWRESSPAKIREAMQSFVDSHARQAATKIVSTTSLMDFGRWLFSTEHVSIQYSIRYENVELRHLSPGTRGVVLMMLYLALDDTDERPLIIDQPEENLDPRSIYEVLVPFFRDAAERRQIVLVTHNANLVVNADSDQVIVVDSVRRSDRGLPTFTYNAGGLEDPQIRFEVCRLLEGGKEAFAKRGRRYGLRGNDRQVPLAIGG